PRPSFTNTPTSTPVPVLTATPSRTPTKTPVPPTPGATPVVASHSYFYPSPVRGDTGTIAYALRSAANVTIRLYNVTGRQVDAVTEAKPGGWQASTVAVGKFASGTYYYVVTAQYFSGGSEVQAPRKFAVLH
ncbi:MAG TPA: T9SS type A sorting domain-containing protein, partial [bacterium]|nr:T9SS type A sorting domain-containing protein [bacterium]